MIRPNSIQLLANELAYCVYLIRMNNEITKAVGYTEDCESSADLFQTSKIFSHQNNDVLILQRNRLVGLINGELLAVGSNIKLRADEEFQWRIFLSGDQEKPEFSVSFIQGRYLKEHVDENSADVKLFFPSLDYHEIPKLDANTARGEFWLINGNTDIGKALWPFRIDYDGCCILLEQKQNVLVCENSEK